MEAWTMRLNRRMRRRYGALLEKRDSMGRPSVRQIVTAGAVPAWVVLDYYREPDGGSVLPAHLVTWLERRAGLPVTPKFGRPNRGTNPSQAHRKRCSLGGGRRHA